jgi:hypothetical protein
MADENVNASFPSVYSDSDKNLDDICWRLDRNALLSAEEAKDPAQQLKWLEISQIVRARCKAVAEETGAKLEARTRQAEVDHQRSRFIATTLTPVLSVLITALALVFQAQQFKKTSETQARQSEDEKWRESMKAVSLADPKSSMVGALAMQTFFRSERYSPQSQMIAAALLPNVNNVTGFDEVFDELVRSVDKDRQYLITGIGSMLLMAAREEHHLTVPTLVNPSETPPFLEHDVTSIDPNPDFTRGGETMRDKVLAWELDSVSQGLSRLWLTRKFSPDKYLVSIVIENASFAGIDFSNRNLERSVFLDADLTNVKLTNANLEQASFRNVTLKGSDLSGIVNFEGSTWQNVEWWRAKCLSSELYDYLSRYNPIPQRQRDSVPSKAVLTNCASR